MFIDPSTYRRLGRTEFRVSPVAVGCWALAGDSLWGAQDEAAAVAALRTAVDCGVNFFDTAEGYGGGYSEEVVGKALHGLRDRVVIGTKVSPAHAQNWADLERSCDQSLQRLKTDRVDV